MTMIRKQLLFLIIKNSETSSDVFSVAKMGSWKINFLSLWSVCVGGWDYWVLCCSFYGLYMLNITTFYMHMVDVG